MALFTKKNKPSKTIKGKGVAVPRGKQAPLTQVDLRFLPNKNSLKKTIIPNQKPD